MFKGLWLKFFILLMIVVTIALMASFVIRHLMIQDFREYEEGQLEDRVYWVIADSNRHTKKIPSGNCIYGQCHGPADYDGAGRVFNFKSRSRKGVFK